MEYAITALLNNRRLASGVRFATGGAGGYSHGQTPASTCEGCSMKNQSKSAWELLDETGVFLTLVVRWEKELTQESVDVLLRAKDNINKLKSVMMKSDARSSAA